jgi:hypothetical protein
MHQPTSTALTLCVHCFVRCYLVAGLPAEGKGSSRLLSITLCKAPPFGSDERYAMWPGLLLSTDDSRPPQDQLRAL